MSLRSNTQFNERLDRILANKVEEKKIQIAKQTHSNLRFALIPLSVAGMFFLLKAAALTQSGVPFMPQPAENAPALVRAHHWFAGADPVTRVLASALGGTSSPQPVRQVVSPEAAQAAAPRAPAPTSLPAVTPEPTELSPRIRAEAARLLTETKA